MITVTSWVLYAVLNTKAAYLCPGFRSLDSVVEHAAILTISDLNGPLVAVCKNRKIKWFDREAKNRLKTMFKTEFPIRFSLVKRTKPWWKSVMKAMEKEHEKRLLGYEIKKMGI